MVRKNFKFGVFFIFLITASLFVSLSFADDEEKAESNEGEKTDKAVPISIFEKTLNKVPAIKKDVKKEEIKTRLAAVTRADKQTKEKLPLIWKLDKEEKKDSAEKNDSDQKGEDGQEKKSDQTPTTEKKDQ
ncbi:MAG: hypothetical protein B6244_11365 [Candidatus Cloacimonetes bacterium 4572_55]|nr:MAG: hypothetical protein B6244_11365 [Candidatus Cloacimonetes bacterium 4572_55]